MPVKLMRQNERVGDLNLKCVHVRTHQRRGRAKARNNRVAGGPKRSQVINNKNPDQSKRLKINQA